MTITLTHHKKAESIHFSHQENNLGDDGALMDRITKDHVSRLSATHWRGTTVRDNRNPTDLMKCSRFPHEDRTAQEVVQELIAISNELQPRWEAYQAHQVWVKDDKNGPEPTFQDEQTGLATSGKKGMSPSPRVNKSLNDFVGLTLKQFTPELQQQVLKLCEEGLALKAVDELRQMAIHAEESMEQEALALVFEAVKRNPDTYKADVHRLARKRLGLSEDVELLPTTERARLALFESLVVDYPRELQEAQPELYQGMVFPYFDNYEPLVKSEQVLLTTPFVMQRKGTPYHFAGGAEDLLLHNPGLVEVLTYLEDKPAELKVFKEQHPELFGLQHLSEKVITFVGAGFPLTGVVQHIIGDGMRIQLVDYDAEAVKNAIHFIGLAENVGAVKPGQFQMVNADARDITYVPSHRCNGIVKEVNSAGETHYTLGTDVLDLASALPRDVTEQVMEQAAREIPVIRKRNVEGMSKLLYEEFKLPSNSIYYMAGVVTPPQKVIAGSFGKEDVTSYSLDINVNSGSVFHNRETFKVAEKDLFARLKAARANCPVERSQHGGEDFCSRVTSYYH